MGENGEGVSRKREEDKEGGSIRSREEEGEMRTN